MAKRLSSSRESRITTTSFWGSSLACSPSLTPKLNSAMDSFPVGEHEVISPMGCAHIALQSDICCSHNLQECWRTDVNGNFCAKHCLGGSEALFPQNKYQINAEGLDWRHHALGDAGRKMRYGTEVYL